MAELGPVAWPYGAEQWFGVWSPVAPSG